MRQGLTFSLKLSFHVYISIITSRPSLRWPAFHPVIECWLFGTGALLPSDVVGRHFVENYVSSIVTPQRVPVRRRDLQQDQIIYIISDFFLLHYIINISIGLKIQH